jgi:hypothetical protein
MRHRQKKNQNQSTMRWSRPPHAIVIRAKAAVEIGAQVRDDDRCEQPQKPHDAKGETRAGGASKDGRTSAARRIVAALKIISQLAAIIGTVAVIADMLHRW